MTYEQAEAIVRKRSGATTFDETMTVTMSKDGFREIVNLYRATFNGAIALAETPEDKALDKLAQINRDLGLDY